jgi:hypothetical protein
MAPHLPRNQACIFFRGSGPCNALDAGPTNATEHSRPALWSGQQLSGWANGAAPECGGSGRSIPGQVNRDGSSPGSMPIRAGPAGHGKGELHRIERNTIPPGRVNGHGVPMGQLQCPVALSRATTATFWQRIEDVRIHKRDGSKGRSGNLTL